jgi:hypothetical protein
MKGRLSAIDEAIKASDKGIERHHSNCKMIAKRYEFAMTGLEKS